MSSIPSNLSRVSSNMISQLLVGNLRNTNVELLKAQEQLSTGKRVNRPSDDASVISAITLFNRILRQQDQRLTNLAQAQGTIDNTDTALADVSDLLIEARSIAQSEHNTFGSDAGTRAAQAEVIQGIIDSLFATANRAVRGVQLFGGSQPNQTPFVEHLGGIRYMGPRDNLDADLGFLSSLGVNTNGVEAFGALSSRIVGTVDLDPDATATTRVADVNGARGRGVVLGAININIDGVDVELDLTGADTLGDIVTRINDAINTQDPTAGSVSLGVDGFSLTANPAHTITISDIGTGVVAADLGIDISATAATTVGGDIDPRVTLLTDVADFGVAVDLAGGLNITNGSRTAIVSFAAANTVQDMINLVNQADLGVRMEINSDGSGLQLVNEVSGTTLSIGENAGGTTATDLGLRTYDTSTLLSDLRFGLGIQTVTGDDVRIHTHDGTDIDVDLSSATTIGDVITLIEAAATTAGLIIPADFDVSFASDGNGLVITDNTVGVDNFQITGLNNSLAGDHLGIWGNAGAGATITAEDNALVRTESVFTHLMMLRDGLLNNDLNAIADAGSRLEGDIASVASARAQVGVRSQRIQQQVSRIEEQQFQTQSLLSTVQDADYNEVISRFVQLQQQLQGTLLSGQQMLSLSLLDFLR